LVIDAPMAALAVARIIANAAMRTRSDRDSASLVLRIISGLNSLRLLVSLRLSGLVYFALAFLAPSGVFFAVAISITLFRFGYVLKNFPKGSSTNECGCDKSRPDRQINFLGYVTMSLVQPLKIQGFPEFSNCENTISPIS
jgi:hypothetical protein